MAYRIGPSGATSSGPVYLYGYSFALNSAKTVKSITLPNNRNVVVLAVDVTPADSGSAAADAGGESDLEPLSRDLHLDPIGHAHRYDAGGADLLHHQRHHPHDELGALQPRHAAAGGLHHHHRGDRGRKRLQQ